MRERVGGGHGAQRMHAEPFTSALTPPQSVFSHNVAVDRSGIERPVQLAGAVVRHRTEEGGGGIGAWPGRPPGISLDQALRQPTQPLPLPAARGAGLPDRTVGKRHYSAKNLSSRLTRNTTSVQPDRRRCRCFFNPKQVSEVPCLLHSNAAQTGKTPATPAP
jgi:hypothetical protein